MKLPKQNSEPLHVRAMKLRFILPFYLTLASITFCSRKISDNREANFVQKEQVTAVTEPGKVTGTLELDPATNTIYADLWLMVSSSDFMYAHNFMPLQTKSNYKGIAFRYYDAVHHEPDHGKDTTKIHIVFNFVNDMKWNLNDKIRVMSLDEDEKATFDGLKDYFMKRMDYFGTKPCSDMALLDFNQNWNSVNPKNPVSTDNDKTSGAIEHKTSQNKNNKGIPRLTKDDGILLLKLKK